MNFSSNIITPSYRYYVYILQVVTIFLLFLSLNNSLCTDPEWINYSAPDPVIFKIIPHNILYLSDDVSCGYKKGTIVWYPSPAYAGNDEWLVGKMGRVRNVLVAPRTKNLHIYNSYVNDSTIYRLVWSYDCIYIETSTPLMYAPRRVSDYILFTSSDLIVVQNVSLRVCVEKYNILSPSPYSGNNEWLEKQQEGRGTHTLIFLIVYIYLFWVI